MSFASLPQLGADADATLLEAPLFIVVPAGGREALEI